MFLTKRSLHRSHLQNNHILLPYHQTIKDQNIKLLAARSKHISLQPGECRALPEKCRPFRSARTVSGFLENISCLSLRLFSPLFQLLLISIISFTEGLVFLWKTSQTSRPPSKTLFALSLSLYPFPVHSFHSFFCHIGCHFGDWLIPDCHQIDDLTMPSKLRVPHLPAFQEKL